MRPQFLQLGAVFADYQRKDRALFRLAVDCQLKPTHQQLLKHQPDLFVASGRVGFRINRIEDILRCNPRNLKPLQVVGV